MVAGILDKIPGLWLNLDVSAAPQNLFDCSLLQGPHTHAHTTILPLDFARDNPGQLVSEGTFRHLDFLQNEDNTGRCTNNPAGWCPHVCHPHHFHARCPSWHNTPNSSWLGTGTKYAGLHTRWLVRPAHTLQNLMTINLWFFYKSC